MVSLQTGTGLRILSRTIGMRIRKYHTNEYEMLHAVIVTMDQTSDSETMATANASGVLSSA